MSSTVAEKEAGPINEKEPIPESNDAPPAATGEKKKREYKEFGHDEHKATRECFVVVVVVVVALNSDNIT